MDNSPYEALPSNWKNSRRDLNKASNTADSTYANIRKRLSAAIISVPYERGLGSLHVLKNNEHRLSPLDREVLHKTTKDRRHYNVYARMPRSKNLSEQSTPRNVNLAPVRPRPKARDASPDTASLPSRPTKSRSDRIGSETSTISVSSRPYSFSNSEFDESFWVNNLKHIEELKEKYSENSDFVASIHGFRHQKEQEAKKKEKEMDKMKLEKIQAPKKPRSRDGTVSSNDKVLDFLNEKPLNGKRITPERGRITLPPINSHVEEDRRSEGSGWTLPSNTESSSSTTKSKKSHKVSTITKRRKVEFNLIPKKKLVLPPLTSNSEDRHPIKSILKKDGIVTFTPRSPSLSSYGETGEHLRGAVNKTSWEDHLPRLRSPVPLSAAKRDPSMFDGNSRGFYFKCSKDFEAALGNIDVD